MSGCYCTGACKLTGICQVAPRTGPLVMPSTMPTQVVPFTDAPVGPQPSLGAGWRCPVCGAGNAPFVQRCSCTPWPKLEVTC